MLKTIRIYKMMRNLRHVYINTKQIKKENDYVN